MARWLREKSALRCRSSAVRVIRIHTVIAMGRRVVRRSSSAIVLTAIPTCIPRIRSSKVSRRKPVERGRASSTLGLRSSEVRGMTAMITISASGGDTVVVRIGTGDGERLIVSSVRLGSSGPEWRVARDG